MSDLINNLSELVYPNRFESYIKRVPSSNLMYEFEIQLNAFSDFFGSLTPDIHDYTYQDGKWTIKELLQHIIDVERRYATIALSIARKVDPIDLNFNRPSHNLANQCNHRELKGMLIEFAHLRRSTMGLFQSFDENMLKNKAKCGDDAFSTIAVGFFIIGHEMHHRHIVYEKYL